jgi:hypothetical protein
MITLAALQTYESFGGSLDGHVRTARAQGLPPIGDADWALIDELLMQLDAAASGLASAAFVHQLDERIHRHMADVAAAAELRALAARRRGRP